MRHNKSLPPEHIKFKITEATQPDEELSIGGPYCGSTIREKITNIVEWPKKWDERDDPDHQTITPREMIKKFQTDFHRYYDKKETPSITIDITSNVYGSGDIELHISMEEVDWMCIME